MKLRLSLLSCLLFAVGCSGVVGATPSLNIQLPASGASTLLIDDHGRAGKINFRHSVDGYEVSCDGRAMAVWGKPLKLNENNPQDSNLTIVDLRSLKMSRQIAFSKGIFGVEFLKTKPLLLVGTEAGELVNFDSGKTMPTPPNQDFSPEAFPRESCDDFESKSYRRYKD